MSLGSRPLNGNGICFSFCFARGIFRTCEIVEMMETDKIGFHPGTWSLSNRALGEKVRRGDGID